MDHLKAQLPNIEEFFKDLDSDGSGFITEDELMMIPPELAVELMAITGGDNLSEIFEQLDEDGSKCCLLGGRA